MPLSIHSYRHFPAHRFVTYHADLFPGQGTVRSVSYRVWPLLRTRPRRQWETLSLNITLLKAQSLHRAEARVWCRNEFAMAPLYCSEYCAEKSDTSSE